MYRNPHDPIDVSEYRTHRFERERFVTQAAMDPSYYRFEVSQDELIPEMRARLERYVWSLEEESKEVTLEVSVPTSWWQMLKRDHAPLWFIRRFPVKFGSVSETKVLKLKALFPDFQPPVEAGRPVLTVVERTPFRTYRS